MRPLSILSGAADYPYTAPDSGTRRKCRSEPRLVREAVNGNPGLFAALP
jgi:hypothetical protein